MASETEEQNNHFYFQKFQAEHSNIHKDIVDFVYMVLKCCSRLEEKIDHRVVSQMFTKTSEKLQSLIKSLCLIHALYGYPNETATSMDENAVRTLVETLKVKDGEGFALVRYCEKAAEDEFWQFEFRNGTSSLENLLREPAYIFLEVVRNLFPKRKKASSFGRCFLKTLPEVNCLKPTEWAEHIKKAECYGVSLGVPPFVRPLYLYIKLSRLKNVEDGQLSLKDVKALKINRLNDAHRTLCFGCQRFFGLFSFPPFGNCAEYDVIGNVKPDLLNTNQTEWEGFKSACQQHLDAFNKMLEMLEEARYPYNQILKIYFEKTMNSKILKYQWNPEKKDFQLTLENWLPPVQTGQTQLEAQLKASDSESGKDQAKRLMEQLKKQTELQRMTEKDTKRLLEQLERQNQRFEAQLKISDFESGKNEQENWQMEQERDREQEKLRRMLQVQLKEEAKISRILKNEQENWQMEQKWDRQTIPIIWPSIAKEPTAERVMLQKELQRTHIKQLEAQLKASDSETEKTVALPGDSSNPEESEEQIKRDAQQFEAQLEACETEKKRLERENQELQEKLRCARIKQEQLEKKIQQEQIKRDAQQFEAQLEACETEKTVALPGDSTDAEESEEDSDFDYDMEDNYCDLEHLGKEMLQKVNSSSEYIDAMNSVTLKTKT